MVSGIACALSVDTDNDTCNGNGCALFSRHIVLEGGNFKFRNYAIVRNGSSRSVGSSNCTDDLIVNSLKRELVNLDGPLGATLDCSDLVAVSCPRNHVFVETDHYLTEHLIVNRGNRVCVLILSVKECSSCFYIVRGSGSSSFLCRGLFSTLGGSFFLACSGFFLACSGFFFTCSGFFLACGCFFVTLTGITSRKNRKAQEHC